MILDLRSDQNVDSNLTRKVYDLSDLSDTSPPYLTELNYFQVQSETGYTVVLGIVDESWEVGSEPNDRKGWMRRNLKESETSFPLLLVIGKFRNTKFSVKCTDNLQYKCSWYSSSTIVDSRSLHFIGLRFST